MSLRKYRTFDVAEFLDSEEIIAAYMEDALADSDPSAVISALTEIARARAITELANLSGIERKELIQMLHSEVLPNQNAIHKLIEGIKMCMHPVRIGAD